ncbi:MAG TPA: hypothetical protein VG710_13370 [Opitutus sp.]|nr:hypothetical protein [Opitutus sp.]
MPTFREAYCAQHECPPEQFAARVFWRSLYPHALPVAPLLLWLNYDYFSPDRSLILLAGDATSVTRVREEVRDYFWDSANRGWMRRTLRLRVSGQRLKNVSRRYLPEDSPPSETTASTARPAPKAPAD